MFKTYNAHFSFITVRTPFSHASRLLLGLLVLTFGLAACGSTTEKPKNVKKVDAGTYIISAADGRRLKIQAYGENIIRAHTVKKDEEFFADDYYEMVETHDWPRMLSVKDLGERILFSTESAVSVIVNKQSLAVSYLFDDNPLLEETSGVTWEGNTIKTRFLNGDEHFTGLGHGYFGRADSIDLRDKVINRNYGRQQIEQAPLIVPFYLSNKGYGVFLNSMFPNEFSFGANDEYSIAIEDYGFGGQLDYFFIAGPEFKDIIERYTHLTGRPRLPSKSMFGLQLSDKGHDHNSPTPSDEKWWKNKIKEHRDAGYPLDHVVNDNRWRAAGGKRCESKLDWDEKRYPDPKAYGEWLEEQGLTMTLDFNRCIANDTDGWKPEFNLPETGKIDFADSAPDLTNADFRAWFWQAFYNAALNPELEYPGDALWIDEFDEQGAAPKRMILANGRSSAEMRNYWFFLIAKALVEEGWDKAELNKRPFVWVRGMTAGAQRYATLWSGDIYPHYEDMATQVRGMQLAGMSGFPYWGHDAGGFHNWDTGEGPDDELYINWSMALGSVSPIWKPHGMGQSRWPLDRSEEVQKFAHKYSKFRYELMPYIYWMAHLAAETGYPIVRPMVFEHQNSPEAWKHDLQFMLGHFILVAPNTTGEPKLDVWLPWGNWYNYDTKELIRGNQVITVDAPLGHLPMFVKAGAVIPKNEYALSTQFINNEKLILDVYAGGNYAHAEVFEDDGESENYRNGDFSVTRISNNAASGYIRIRNTKEQAPYLPEQRAYEINMFGEKAYDCVIRDNEKLKGEKIEKGYRFVLPPQPVGNPVHLHDCKREGEEVKGISD